MVAKVKGQEGQLSPPGQRLYAPNKVEREHGALTGKRTRLALCHHRRAFGAYSGFGSSTVQFVNLNIWGHKTGYE